MCLPFYVWYVTICTYDSALISNMGGSLEVTLSQKIRLSYTPFYPISLKFT